MDIKQEILRMLKEDEEFRYAVAGLLGLGEILEELRKLREDLSNFMRLESQRWEENWKRWEENSRRWEENAKRWEENWKRWEENSRRWEENAKRWEENWKRWEEQLRFNRWLANALIEIRDSLGGAYEHYTANWVRIWLEERGFRCDVRVGITLPVEGLFREIDVICFDPLVVGEATLSLKTIERAENELKKLLANVEVAERFVGRKAYAKVLAVENAPNEIAEYLRKRCEELGVMLVLGRSYD
ncbi:MAG: hypothetical protein QXJ48_05940 [Candidatus Korarchaeum sp.]